MGETLRTQCTDGGGDQECATRLLAHLAHTPAFMSSPNTTGKDATFQDPRPLGAYGGISRFAMTD